MRKNMLQLPYYDIFYFCWEIFDMKHSLQITHDAYINAESAEFLFQNNAL